MEDNLKHSVLRACLQFINIDLCILGVVGVLSIISLLQGVAELNAAHESGSSYLPYYLFFPVALLLSCGLVPGILGCLVIFKQTCLTPSCIIGVIWSLLALVLPGRRLLLYTVSFGYSTTSDIIAGLILATLLVIPLLWTFMTIKYVRKYRAIRQSTEHQLH